MPGLMKTDCRREEGFYRLPPAASSFSHPSFTFALPAPSNWIRENNSRLRSILRDNAFRGEHMLIFANGGAPDALNQRFFNSSPIAPSGSRMQHVIGCEPGIAISCRAIVDCHSTAAARPCKMSPLRLCVLSMLSTGRT